MQSALRLAFATPGNLPIVIDRNAVTFSAAAIESRTMRLDVMFGSATDEVREFRLGKIWEATTFAAGTHRHAPHHSSIKLQTLFRLRCVGWHVGFRAHHPAANVVANRPHRN